MDLFAGPYEDKSAAPLPDDYHHKPYVVDGKVIRLTASTLEAFNTNAPTGCHRRWWFRYVAELPDGDTKAKNTGKEVHAQLEHLLKTGDDTLGHIARPGKPLVERFIKKAQIEKQWWIKWQGVDWQGTSDIVYDGGVFFDGTKTHDDTDTLEIADHKTTSNISAYAKTGDALIKTAQMPLYAAAFTKLQYQWPADNVRLTHIYYQTKGKAAAEVRSTKFTWWHIEKRANEIVQMVETLRGVAAEKDIVNVSANDRACYGYNQICPYANRCPEYGTRAFFMTPTNRGKVMGFGSNAAVKKPPATQAATHTQPPATGAPQSAMDKLRAAAAAKAEEKRLKEIEEAERARMASEGTASDDDTPCDDCGETLIEDNISVLPDKQTVVHVGCPARKAAPKPAAAVAPPDVKPSTVADSAPVAAEDAAKVPARRGRPPKSGDVASTAATAPAKTVADVLKDKLLAVNCVVSGRAPICLDEAINAALSQASEACGGDVRLSEAGSFGKWKAIVAEVVTAQLAPDITQSGLYTVTTLGSELREAAAAAIAPLFDTVVYGAN